MTALQWARVIFPVALVAFVAMCAWTAYRSEHGA
jgi:hypothetical protein